MNKPKEGFQINVPEKLDDSLFYGINLDEEQRKFRDAIWDKNNSVIFCNAKAGTGKTLIAIATANLLHEYGLYDNIIYVAAPTQEKILGYMQGSYEEKS